MAFLALKCRKKKAKPNQTKSPIIRPRKVAAVDEELQSSL
jgi:hypothetical protein